MTLRWVPGWSGLTEPEAVSYVAAVEAADGQELEFGVAKAINDFVLGCKQDGIWDAIKASCILAGARTLAGALVPLVGTAPTNYNFVSGDYDRETGLVGDGSTKYLDSNRNNNADPQDSQHMAVYATSAGTYGTRMYIGAGGSTGATGATHFNISFSNMGARNRSSSFNTATNLGSASGFFAINRSLSTEYNYRFGASSGSFTVSSQTPVNGNIQIYANEAAFYNNARLAFYSIGESLDLAALDTRVSALITAIGAAIT
jgi:hypothetical protein